MVSCSPKVTQEEEVAISSEEDLIVAPEEEEEQVVIVPEEAEKTALKEEKVVMPKEEVVPDEVVVPKEETVPNDVISAGPPAVPHDLEGRDDCLSCHALDGIKPYPTEHNDGRPNFTCTSCHEAPLESQPITETITVPLVTQELQPPTSQPTGTAPELSTALVRGCESGSRQSEKGLPYRSLAVDFTLKDVDGQEYTLSKLLAEKPVVMIFGSFT